MSFWIELLKWLFGILAIFIVVAAFVLYCFVSYDNARKALAESRAKKAREAAEREERRQKIVIAEQQLYTTVFSRGIDRSSGAEVVRTNRLQKNDGRRLWAQMEKDFKEKGSKNG